MRETASPPTPTREALPTSAPSIPWRTMGLVVGDAVSFLVFAGVGRQQHSETSGLSALGQIAATAVPFALGWFAASPFIGVFRRQLTDTPLKMLRRVELAWLASWPLTLLLRFALASDHKVPLSFAIVILIANAIFLAVWRGAFAMAERYLHH